MSRNRALKIAVPTAAALVAGGAVALAAIPASDGTIHGCYANGGTPTGALRIVDEGVQCATGETAITWNQRGPEGPAGPTGPQGDTGPAGDSGSTGSGTTGSFDTQGGGPSADLFLKLDGIAGESTDDAHKGEIDVEAFAFGVKRGATAGGAGAGGGGSAKVRFAPLRVVKVYDASSPKLLQAAATGHHIKSGVLTFRRSGDSGDAEFLTYKLSDVIVSSYQQGGVNADDKPLGSLEEEVGLSPAKVQVTEKTTTDTGQAGPVVTASWDLRPKRP
jgi:type VI secretion system secreted protein Hcp